MATLEDVRRLALALPHTAERASYGGAPSWTVKDKAFVWERPLRAKELLEVVDLTAASPVLAARVADEGIKHALIADQPGVFFTISHFDGYPAVLVRLEDVGTQELQELVTEAWLARAPRRLAVAFERT